LEACGGDVLVQDLLEQVMHWHFVLLAAPGGLARDFSWRRVSAVNHEVKEL
jgi:hypothetical protein